MLKQSDKQETVIDINAPIVDYNFHTHTKRCGHASGEDHEYIEAAIKRGYKIIGISDHCPYKEMSLPIQRMEWNEFFEYVESIKKLKDEYSDKIDIYIGLECEYYAEHLEQLKYLKKYVDYLILGQHHYIDGKTTKSYVTEKEMLDMVEEIRAGVKEELFLYIAHPDYFWRERHIYDDIAIKVSHEICKISKEYDIPLELNHKLLSIAKYEIPEIWEGCLYFWSIAKEYNCKVCIGMDAHDPNKFFDDIVTEETIINSLELNLVSTEELIKRIKNKE